MPAAPQSGPLVAVCANQAWNLVNFRSGLIRALLADGCRVLAIAPADPAMAARLEAMGCSFAALPMEAAGISLRKDFATVVALFRLLRAHRPAAWLSWTIKPNVYGSFAASLLGIAAFPNVSGLGTAFIRRSLLTVVVKWLYRIGFRRAHSVFFQNADDRDLFVGLRLVPPGRARLLPGSGIDPEHFRPQSGNRPRRGNFLMVARLLADKGVREYVEAARKLREDWPDARFRLLGFLDVENRTAITRQEVAGWVAQGLIEYLPAVDDVRPLIEAADFVVLPSYREGLSRVLLEAAAMRRPIVATDVPGCRDIVTDGVNGFLCAARDADALAAAMARALETGDDTWQRMAEAGRARVIAEFSQEKVTGLYRAALQDVMASSGSEALPNGTGMS